VLISVKRGNTSIRMRAKFGYGSRALRLKAFDIWEKVTFTEGFHDWRTGGGCGPFPIFLLYLEIRLSSIENHERKRIHGSRGNPNTARSVDLAVLFAESLDCSADFRSLSADASDDCGHPSVSKSVFQVAELGGCPHQLVLGGKSRL
jgi:hypothetical protein